MPFDDLEEPIDPNIEWDLVRPEPGEAPTLTKKPLVIMAKLKQELSRGVRNNATLQKAIEYLGATRVLTITLEYMAHIEPCNACRLWCYASDLKPAYLGQQFICSACLPSYEWCEQCNSLKLRTDTVMHFHTDELRAGLLGEEAHLFNFDFDIMANGRRFRSAKEERKPKLRTPMYFGVELEVERRPDAPSPPDLILKAVRSLADRFAIAKRDGSLRAAPGERGGTNGMEIVTQPATLAYHETEAGWEKLFAALSPFCEERPPTAGLHFHVNSRSVTVGTVAKVAKFINDPSNLQFLRLVADRDFNLPSPATGRVYAPVAPDFSMAELIHRKQHRPGCPMTPWMRTIREWYIVDGRVQMDYAGHPIIQAVDGQTSTLRRCNCPEGHYDYPNHYSALNVRTHKPTFEFRIFQASMNQMHFFACLEFCEALIYFCEDRGFGDLTSEAFLDSFRRKQYPNLANWLVICGLIMEKSRKKLAA